MTWLHLAAEHAKDIITFLACFLTMAVLEEYWWVRRGHPPTWRWRK